MVGAALRIQADPNIADPLLSTTVQPVAPAMKVDGPQTVIPVANSANFVNGNHVLVQGREHVITAVAANQLTMTPGH